MNVRFCWRYEPSFPWGSPGGGVGGGDEMRRLDARMPRRRAAGPRPAALPEGRRASGPGPRGVFRSGDVRVTRPTAMALDALVL